MTVATIFSKAVAMVENVAHSAHNILVKVFGADAVSAVESDLSVIFREDVLTIFSDAISAAESLQVDGQPASGDQRRTAAFGKIAEDLKTAGVSLADHTINLGIELVVGFLKNKKTAVAASAPVAAIGPAVPATPVS